jgi:MFS family permease
LFLETNFVLLWSSSILASLALCVATLAETWYVVGTLGAKDKLGLVVIAASVPRIVLMLVGGAAADRGRRSRLIITSLLARVALMLGLALLVRFGAAGITTLTSFAFLYGALDAFFWPARDALLSSAVAREQMTRANSVMLTSNQVCFLVGPVVAAAMLATMSATGIFATTAGVLAIGAALVGFVREDGAAQPATTPGRIIQDVREGLRYAVGSPILRAMLLIYGPANLLFMGPHALGLPILVTERLHGGPSQLSFFQSAFAAGMILGGTLLTIWTPKRKRFVMIAVAIAAEGLCLAALAYSTSVVLGLVFEFLIGLGVACNNVPLMALLQKYTEPERIGRVMSLNTVAWMGLTPLSYALVTSLVSAHVSISPIMAVLGLAMSALMVTILARVPVVRTTD